MAKFVNVAIVVVVAAAAILQTTDAANYTVGGSTGWTNDPTGGASFYSNWAKNFTFKVNDVLEFPFTTGRHVVAEITKANFDACNVSSNQVWASGPAAVTLNRTGDYYFACAFTGHCSSGQKLSVSVSSGSSSAAPSPSGSSPSPNSTTGTTAPAPQGSATSLAAATFSVLLMTIAFNLLF